jgi:hypothetical protein
MSAITVDISDFVSMSVTITPTLTPYQNFSGMLILGDSNVIDAVQRLRKYSGITAVGADFSTISPEYQAATVYFEQSPQPQYCYIGRWVSTNASAILQGATLTPTQALLSNFTAITNGSFALSIDGTPHNITGLNFSSAANLNAVASAIQTALQAASTTTVKCVWNASFTRFDITSGITTSSSAISYATTLGTLAGSTDISTLLGLTAAAGAQQVPYTPSESALVAAQTLAVTSSAWYGLHFATTASLQLSDYEAVAAYILASNRSRMFGITSSDTNILNSALNTDIASVIQSLNNKRVFVHYSSSNPYAGMTDFGRIMTTNFDASNTMITLAYKQAPGIIGENLNETQFAALVGKGANVVINVDNGATMIWPGQMTNGYWVDEVYGVDWQANRIQTNVFNLFYGTSTKIPQTDPGDNQIATAIAAGCEAGVNNGLLAPGVWNASGFGMLTQGMVLSKGYYIYYPPIATQSENLREERVSVPFQVAVKLSGAVQQANVLLNVNP